MTRSLVWADIRTMRNKVAVFAVAAFAAVSSLAERASEKIVLWPEGRIPSFQEKQKVPYLLWFKPDELKTKAVLIAVSGGGYNGNGITGFEVSPMRDYMLAKGMTVVTMLYRTPRPAGLPKHLTAWQDAQRTVRIVRAEARKRGLDPDSIGFTGCSAGGHLAVMTAVSSQTPAYEPVDALDAIPCNVNWAIPVYPAYLLADGLDQYNVTRGNDLAVGFAPEFAFDAATPPMCLFHGDADDWSAMGSVRTYHKLRTMGIPSEVHVLARENHCFQSNPRPGTPAAIWKDFAWAWLVSIDAVTGHPATWGKEWVSPLKLGWNLKLSDYGDFEPGAWRTVDWSGAVLTAEKETPFWLKGEFGDFTLDFEYRLDAAAETGILVRADTAAADRASSALLVRFPAGGIGAWNRMTVWADGDDVRARVNGADLDAKCLVKPVKALAAKGAIGFCGMRGKARPSFRNIRVKGAFRDNLR